jgi:hypothetical protein
MYLAIVNSREEREPIPALRAVLGELRQNEVARRLRLEKRIDRLCTLLDDWSGAA